MLSRKTRFARHAMQPRKSASLPHGKATRRKHPPKGGVFVFRGWEGPTCTAQALPSAALGELKHRFYREAVRCSGTSPALVFHSNGDGVDALIVVHYAARYAHVAYRTL